MKKLLALVLAALMLSGLTACSSAPAADTTAAETTEPETKWKDVMAGLTKTAGARAIIFRNMTEYDETVEEFKDFGPVPEEEDGAYSIAVAAKIWTKGVNGDLTALDADGQKTVIPAADLETAQAAVQEDGTVDLRAGNAIVKNIKYLITPDKEALLFVAPEETIAMKDMFTAMGYEACTNVFATASDGFWCCTSDPSETEGSEIRGLLSGSVNCNLTVEGKGGAGKINDLFYVDIVE